MSHPLPFARQIIPATISCEGALEALRAVEPAFRWFISGSSVVGNIGNHSLWLTPSNGLWTATLSHLGYDVFGMESWAQLAVITSECALGAVEELSELLIIDHADAA